MAEDAQGDSQQQDPAPVQDPAPATDDLGDAGKKAIDAMKSERNAARTEAKRLATELEQFRTASMSETEKQIEEARKAGRTEAGTEFGKRLVRTQFDAVAGRRNPDYDIAPALELLDLTKLLGEDGEPDAKAIAAAVERLVPEAQSGPPSFDGGARTSPPATTGMNQLLRQAAGRT